MNERESFPVGFQLGREISEEELVKVSGGLCDCKYFSMGGSNGGDGQVDWGCDF